MTQNPLILAVETSSRIGSVAIAIGGKKLAETTFSDPLRHSAEILPAIHGLLGRFSRRPSQIEHIYISVGPGSFTGLRIATTLAKTMHLANAAKIIAVDTLDVIAANVTDYIKEKNTAIISHSERKEPFAPSELDGEESLEKIAAIVDAKRGQFFIAVYDRKTKQEQRAAGYGIWRKVLPDSLMAASQFLALFSCMEKPIWLLGDGLVYYKDSFRADGIKSTCSAGKWL
ncbi:MAG: tRNA (adenosine(37)-N6)-threonylcarbamoyltransferase complex dimerization subunit type 1 TsaB [Planctomycetota bacterium]|jgi:tRNA threonylcarbamoyl adenosine modification protein YeaZ